METQLMEIKSKYEEILEWLRLYKERTNCRGVVIGISGGKDSTVVAMLAKKVWGDNVFGLLMPNGTQSDINDSIQISETLAINFDIFDICPIYDALIDTVETRKFNIGEAVACASRDILISQKAKTNIPPRIRMTILYAVAQTLGYRVIGTSNASEAYIGWTTKWGDSAYDLNPIAHLTCTEVMTLGELLAEEFGLDKKYVIKPPSDGLCGKTDEDSFGFSYAVLDGYLTGGITNANCETAFKIGKMHKMSEHKRNMPATLK